MPLPYSDQLRLAFSPNEIVYVRFARGLRMRPVAKGILHVPVGSSTPDWRSATRTLATHIDELGPRPAEVTIVLSNHFVRYIVVPWEEGLQDPRRLDKHARRLFREAHGDRADGWRVCANPAIDGKATLACAIDQELHDDLGALFSGTRLRLVSMQPLLMAAFNEFRGTLGDAGSFMLHERGGLCCGTYADGEWRAVEACPMSPDASVIGEVERQLQTSVAPVPQSVFLCTTCPGAYKSRGLAGGRQLHVLNPPDRAGAGFGVTLLGRRR